MRMLYPGSFDPVTRGHEDLIARASAMCEELIVAVLHNPDKKGFFSVEERVKLLEGVCAAHQNVRVTQFSGLTVDLARACGVDAIVRGLRPLGDFESEFNMAQINRRIGGVETVFLPTSPQVADISSSMVRQIAAFGGDIGAFVSPDTEKAVRRAMGIE